ncbi:hypothetical protein TIFTF001_051292 [Ficus carica]|uniref:Uncharacterized protein n=1 Tax=Ficus carica TaxID=3494 RepID=A0AA88CJ81_FICCA|nr:hypothetical protein TIFTF001_051289 [Ficus carica]GMN23159.1 hypothetical protein TIFTF001_051290 [Ficus carica]GMN23182.1 hypothetical protein TIFTF001_051291 [Ficus carica]GMN23195.1 hypothetical protein TIFTF001_051292 [Ficus carica]
MMVRKFSRVIPTCHEGGFGPWFELDWASRPNHSMIARHGKQPTSDIDMDPRQIEEDREASLAFLGMEPRTFDGTQGATGPLPGEGPHYRDPDIYRDMYMRQYVSYVVVRQAYPNESIGMDYLREVRQFTPPPTIEMTLDDMIDTIMEAEIIAYMLQAAIPEDDRPFIPIDDASNGEPILHDGPIMLEEPIPAVPIQAISLQEEDANVDADAEMDPANPGEDPEDPLVIIIASDDEEKVEEELEEDPEEILFDDDDWDADSEVFSDITME